MAASDKRNKRSVTEARLPVGASMEFVAAFKTLIKNLEASLAGAPADRLPVRMVVAGGAAVHFYTAARTSRDVDATFSKRVILPDTGLDIAYIDANGKITSLYFDTQYNDTLGLMHEDAHDDAWTLDLIGINRKILDVRLLSPVDLAVSKLARYEQHDAQDIEALARFGLIDSAAVRARAEHAIQGYIGRLDAINTSLRLACARIDAARGASPA